MWASKLLCAERRDGGVIASQRKSFVAFLCGFAVVLDNFEVSLALDRSHRLLEAAALDAFDSLTACSQSSSDSRRV